MRKYNALLSLLLIAIFLLHGIMGSFMLFGIGKGAGNLLAWIGCGLIVAHTALGAVFTVRTLKSGKTSGAWYPRQNALFWVRRISGVCILVLAFLHFGLFGGEVGERYILFAFTPMRLAIQLLLVAALFTHIFVNIRPLLIALGTMHHKKRTVDLYVALSAILLFCVSAVVFYYVGWLT
jgi:succinate dehydrogenase/fumarate reductase cytochrome b subunit